MTETIGRDDSLTNWLYNGTYMVTEYHKTTPVWDYITEDSNGQITLVWHLRLSCRSHSTSHLVLQKHTVNCNNHSGNTRVIFVTLCCYTTVMLITIYSNNCYSTKLLFSVRAKQKYFKLF